MKDRKMVAFLGLILIVTGALGFQANNGAMDLTPLLQELVETHIYTVVMVGGVILTTLSADL